MNPLFMLAIILAEAYKPRPLRPERGPFMPFSHALVCVATLLGIGVLS